MLFRMLPYPLFFPVLLAGMCLFVIVLGPFAITFELFYRAFRRRFSPGFRDTLCFKFVAFLAQLIFWALMQVVIATVVIGFYVVAVIPLWMTAWIALFRVLYYWRSATARERVFDADMVRAEAAIESHNRPE